MGYWWFQPTAGLFEELNYGGRLNAHYYTNYYEDLNIEGLKRESKSV